MLTPPLSVGDPSTKRPYFVVLFTLAMICVFALIYQARDAVLLSLLGIGIGTLMSPVLSILRRRFKLPRAMSALLLLLICAGSLAGIGYGIFLMVADQVASLAARAPAIMAQLQNLAAQQFTRFPWLEAELAQFHVSAAARLAGAQIFQGITLSASAISGFAFAAIIGLYSAVSAKTYYASVLEAVPHARRSDMDQFFRDSGTALRNWFSAQLTDMVIVGALTGLGLWIVGIDYWALYGLLTGIFGIIPYIGSLFVLVLAGLITLASDPDKVLWVVGVYLLIQQIEGNIILPLVMRGKAELPEVPLLIFMLLLGSWLGLMGVFLAPPMLAVLRVAYRHFYLKVAETPKSVSTDAPLIPPGATLFQPKPDLPAH